ncbi:MAG TPA: DUF58 domain-containing protein, partial [Roseiflexaceae bacterium]
MTRDTILARWRRLRQNLILEGRLRLTRRWMLLPGPLALLLALVVAYRDLFFVGYAYLLLVAVAYLWVREVGPRVRLRRRIRSEWAQVGDELEEQWELINNARLPLLWLEIEDASTLPGYTGRRVAAAGAGEHQRWLTQAVCERRGVYALGPLTARLGDPFGLFRYEWREGDARQIVIYPPLAHLPALDIPQGQRGGLARADLLQQHVTPSVGGLREYVQGDLPSHIHWPTVAKTDRLMVKEFDQERAGALWIALDLHAGAYLPTTDRPLHGTTDDQQRLSARSEYSQSSVVSGPPLASGMDSPLELAITLACSLAAQALAEGRAVGLLADDGRRRLVTPGHGPRQLWRILSELVKAQATGAQPLGEVLRQGYAARASEASGAALVVVTPALDGAWLPGLAGWRRGRPGGALVLLVAARAEQAQPIEARLAASGIAARTFEVGTPLPLLNPPKPRATMRVSPMGRIMRG